MEPKTPKCILFYSWICHSWDMKGSICPLCSQLSKTVKQLLAFSIVYNLGSVIAKALNIILIKSRVYNESACQHICTSVSGKVIHWDRNLVSGIVTIAIFLSSLYYGTISTMHFQGDSHHCYSCHGDECPPDTRVTFTV